ncbi:MAG: FtsW/RodA/SpoVE family cell cycle protein [Eubacterium sp.]|nr:FtsW/RodA/SpoVE family cell cycle protein [Eubacterium sp.]
MLRLYRLRDYNFRLVIWLVLLSVLGIILVSSADPSLRGRQVFGVIVGIAAMILLSLIDYSWILNFYWAAYAANAIMLTLVLLFGTSSHGAARWIEFGGLQFQPTELSKIMIIIFFSMYFMRNQFDLSSFKSIFRALLLLAFPLFLIFRQPDLKNTLTLMMVFCCLYFAAGISYAKIGLVILIVVPLVSGLLFLITKTDLPIIDDYQKNRIMTFMEPENDDYSEDAMQQENSVMAIGSGQLTGKGIGNDRTSSVSKGNFIAEVQNDFIFAVAGEDMGFIGCFAIILLEFLVVFECLLTGKRTKDLSGTLLCTGIGSLVAIQSFINICVACGILPNTGTTLPFISYGLTSLISLYIGMGFVLNAGLQRRTMYGGDILHERRFPFTADSI